MKKLIFINSHPIQYFAPMYKYLNSNGIQTSAWYCNNNINNKEVDKQFGVSIKWDIPLLDGYDYKFFKNNSWKPSHSNGFFGLMNFSMLFELTKIEKSVVVVHGWHYFTHLFIILLGKLCGHTICLRNDMPYNHEKLKRGFKQKFKYFLLKYLVFPRIDYFLYIGNQNKLFYKSYNISDKRLISCPYAVDNTRFQNLIVDSTKVRLKYGIGEKAKIILFSAKYIDKKRPLDLIKAFYKISNPDYWLIMVGEGNLRTKMQEFINAHKMKNVILTGFINQSEIPHYYGSSNLFVMCSGLEENWGLSVNEAMNFNLPIIVSDLTGCSDDLVMNGVNGYVYKTGCIEELTRRIEDVFNNKLSFSEPSHRIVKKYSYEQVCNNLKEIL